MATPNPFDEFDAPTSSKAGSSNPSGLSGAAPSSLGDLSARRKPAPVKRENSNPFDQFGPAQPVPVTTSAARGAAPEATQSVPGFPGLRIPLAQAPEPRTEQVGRVHSALDSVAQGFFSMLADIPKAIGEGAVGIANISPNDIFTNPNNETPEDTVSYKIGQWIEDHAKKLFPVNQKYSHELLAGELPSGIGSLLGFAALGWAGKAAGIPAALTAGSAGALSQGEQGVEDYLQEQQAHGKPDDEGDRFKTFLMNAPLGALYALPIEHFLGRLDKITGGEVKKIIQQSLHGGLEQGAISAVQQLGQNYVAKDVVKYDPKRGVFTGVVQGGETGFLMAALLNAIGLGVAARVRRGVHTDVPDGLKGEQPTVGDDATDPGAINILGGHGSGAQNMAPRMLREDVAGEPEGLVTPAGLGANEGSAPVPAPPGGHGSGAVDVDAEGRRYLPETPPPAAGAPDADGAINLLGGHSSGAENLSRRALTEGGPVPGESGAASAPESEPEPYAGPIGGRASGAQDVRRMLEPRPGAPESESTLRSALRDLNSQIFSVEQSSEGAGVLPGLYGQRDILLSKLRALAPEYVDPRLKRESYRQWLLDAVARDMEPGGGIAVTATDHAGHPAERSSSVNPPWVQDVLSETGLSVAQVRRAARKAVAAENLGVRQADAVSRVLDHLTGERASADNMEFARAQRDKARSLRRLFGFGTKTASAGDEWVFPEGEYDPEMDAAGRTILELAEEARGMGGDIAERAESIMEKQVPDEQVIRELAQLIRENTHAPADLTKGVSLEALSQESAAGPHPATPAGGNSAPEPAEQPAAATVEPGTEQPGAERPPGATAPQPVGALSPDEASQIAREALGPHVEAKPATSEPATIDEAAHDAATSPNNLHPAPTEGQIQSGNYRKGHVRINGLDVSIENPAGSKRRPEWPELAHHYGYIRGTEGHDGDHVDVFIGPHAEDASKPVFIVDQVDKNGKFDEHKVMLGFDSETAARKAYLANYSKGWKGLGDITEMSLADFKKWLRSNDTKKPVGKIGEGMARRPAKAPKKKVKKKASNGGRAAAIDRLQNYFRAGRVIPSGFPGRATHDRVLSFERTSESHKLPWDWHVKVIGTDEHGNAVPGERERVHSTVPSEKNLAEWEREHPVGELSKESPPERPPGKQKKIDDLGEKIGGARKDTSVKTGKSGAKAEKPTQPAWRRKFAVMQIAKSIRPGEEGKWGIADAKTGRIIRGSSHSSLLFDTQEQAEQALPLLAVSEKHSVYPVRNAKGDPEGYTIWRRVTDRKRVQVVKQVFPTREDAMRYMARHAAEILETKTGFGEEILAKPENVYREGKTFRKGDVTGDDFMTRFGFRGVEFGNWNNQLERQEVMNHAYDGLMDLSEILHVPPEALSLNGDLGLAFGARGHGLSGARAHYERSYGVINLTKMSGAGALAHEWFHAFDHYIARLEGKSSSERETNASGNKVYKTKGAMVDFASHGFSYKSKAREELKSAYKGVIDTIYRKAQRYVEDTEQAQKFVGGAFKTLKSDIDAIREDLSRTLTWKRTKNKPATPEQLAEFDKLVQPILDGKDLDTEYRFLERTRQSRAWGTIPGRHTNDTLEAISNILKDVRGRSGFSKENTGALDRVRHAMRRYAERVNMLDEAKKGSEKTKHVPTSYAMEAKKIDQGRASDYWTTPHEMAARAFSAYVEDKIDASGGRSDFLSFGSDNELPQYKMFNVRPFPEGRERVAIDKSFDNLMSVLKTETTDKGTALYSFAGKKAKTADQYSLQAAQEMVDQGAPEEQVRQVTGWHKGADGKWRFEIDDSDASWKVGDPKQSVRSGRDLTVGQMINHPTLFAAYPELADIPIESLPVTSDRAGAYLPKTNTLQLQPRAPKEMLSTLLHELQHVIQTREGFAVGGDPSSALAYVQSLHADKIDKAFERYDGASEKVPDVAEAWARYQWLDSRLKQIHGINEWDEQLNFRPESDRELKKVMTEKEKQERREAQAAYNKAVEAAGGFDSDGVKEFVESGRDLRDKMAGVPQADPYELYRRLSGEVEARNVQGRMSMTAAERRAIAPEMTADVPASDLLVMMNGTEVHGSVFQQHAALEVDGKRFDSARELWPDVEGDDRTRARELAFTSLLASAGEPKKAAAWIKEYERGRIGAKEGFDEMEAIDLLGSLKGKTLKVERLPPSGASATRTGMLSMDSPGTSDDARKRLQGAVDRVLSNAMDGRAAVRIGRTSEPLRRAGLGDNPVSVSDKVIDKAIYDHGLPASAIMSLPEELAEPVMVFKSATQPDSYVVITSDTHRGKPIAVPVRTKQVANHIENVVLSAYAIDDPKRLERWAKDGLLIYADKRKGPDWSQSTGLRLPIEAASPALRKNIVSNEEVFKSQAETPSAGMGAQEAQAVVDRVTRDWKGAKVEVIDNAADIPGSILKDIGASNVSRLRGFYDPATSKTYLVAENVPDAATAERVILHESLHAGLRNVFGSELDPILRDVYQAFGPKGLADIADRYDLHLSKERDRLRAAEEMLARMAQDGAPTKRARTLLQRFLAFVRKWLRGHGFHSLGKMTDDDIRSIISSALRSAREGGSPEMGPRVMASLGEKGNAGNEKKSADAVEEIAQEAPKTYKKLADRVIKETQDRIGWRMSPLGKLPGQERYLTERYKTLGKIADIDQIARRIYDAFSRASAEDQKAVYEYLTTAGAATKGISDPRIAHEAEAAKRLIDRVGRGLVERRLLSRDAFEAHRGAYLPRIYLKHLLGEETFRALGTGRKVSDLGYLKERKDIPEDVRRLILGEVTDPGYLASKGIAKPMRDMAILDFLHTVSQNEDWVAPHATVQWQGRTVTPFWLKNEASRIREQARFYTAQDRSEALKLADKMDEAAQPAIEAMGGKIPADFRQVPNTPRYGQLRGLLVRKEIHSDLIGAGSIMPADVSPAQWLLGYGGVATKVTQLWKMSKVALNPPAQIRNFVSNGILLHLSGVPFVRVPDRVIEAIHEIRTNGKYYRIAKKYGILESTFAARELYHIERDLVDLQARQKGKYTLAALKNFGSRIADKAGDMYQMSEAVFKTAKIIDAMERQGMPADKASLEAQRWLFDYSLIPESVRYLRNAPIGVPFMTFYYKALPRMLEVALKAPWRFVPYVAVPALLNAWLRDQYGVSEKDLDALKLALPTWLQQRGNAYLLPFKDDHGRWQSLDVGYYLPWSMFSDAMGDVSRGDWGDLVQTSGILGGPIPDLISAIQTGVDPFTKQPISNPADPPEKQLGDIMQYVWRLGAPTWLTDIGAAGHLYRTVTGHVNPRTGQPQDTMPQALLRFIGANVYPIRPQISREANIRHMIYNIREVEARARHEIEDRNLDRGQQQSIAAQYRALLVEQEKQLRDYVQNSRVNPRLR